MTESGNEPGLKIVDAFDLPDEVRTILRPGDMLKDLDGRRHRLPRYFYEVPSHEEATRIRLTPHFGLNEFILVDIQESRLLQEYPRYIPCAIRLLAFYLERLREQLGSSIHISVNGGYRSPEHKMSTYASPHLWGTAADIYRIGSVILKDRDSIQKYATLAQDLTDDLRTLPYGHGPGENDDHLHLDLGYITCIPPAVSEDRMEVPQQKPRFAYEDRRRSDRRGDATPPQRIERQ